MPDTLQARIYESGGYSGKAVTRAAGYTDLPFSLRHETNGEIWADFDEKGGLEVALKF